MTEYESDNLIGPHMTKRIILYRADMSHALHQLLLTEQKRLHREGGRLNGTILVNYSPQHMQMTTTTSYTNNNILKNN